MSLVKEELHPFPVRNSPHGAFLIWESQPGSLTRVLNTLVA